MAPAALIPLLLGGAAVVGAVAIGAVVYFNGQEEGAEAVIAPIEAPEVAVVGPEPEVASTVEADVAAVPAAGPPVLQEVRLEADGLAIIAGRASPYGEIVLRLDGGELARVTADGAGAFATIATLETSVSPRVLTAAEILADGSEVPSLDEIILAPVLPVAPEPVVVAEAETITPPQELEVEVPAVAVVPETPALPSAEVAEPSLPAVEPLPQLSPRAVEAPVFAETQTPEIELPEASVPVAILRSNAQGVEVIRPATSDAAPSVMSQVALDAISYSSGGDVQLTGRAQDGSSEVRVYLNNSAIAALDVDTSGGWRGALPDIDTGVYTLRIDEVDETGAVTSRVETPFKREDPVVLAAATDPDAPVSAITVQAGTTLWAIARERYGEGTLFMRVVEANKDLIRDPNLIYPGQVFNLPSE